MKARREDSERGETLARRKGVEKAARARQKALRDAALGPGSLFSEADYKTVRADVVAPSAMVSAGSGAGAGSVSVDALCAGRYPVLGCLRCEAWAGYIASVCQVLLRTPAVAAWLRGHVDQCGSKSDGAGQDCIVCALAESRACLGKAAVPLTVVRRALVDPTFAMTNGIKR